MLETMIDFITKIWFVWILLFSALVYLAFKPIYEKMTGEKSIQAILTSLPKDKFLILSNLHLKNVRDMDKIDYILVSVYGIVVIKENMFTGWVSGTEKQENWILHTYGKQTEFKNPVIISHGQARAIHELTGNEKVKVIPVAAFANTCTLKYKGDKSKVSYFSGLKGFIKKRLPNEVITFAEAERLAGLIRENSLNAEAKPRSISEIEKKIVEKGNTSNPDNIQ